MAYTPEYTTSDLSSITVDILGTGAVEIIQFAGLFVLVVILGWFFVKMKKAGILK
jgi:hypothetical protein